MAVKRPIVNVGGRLKELPVGDTLLAPAVDRGNGFVSWTGEATVTPSTSVALLDSTGAALSPTKTYKVAACNIDSSAQRGAVVLFVGDGSSFTAMTVYEQGTSSSNVQLYLDAGVPSVSVYGGSGSYRIPYWIEEVPNFGQALSEFGILQRLLDAPSDGKTYGRKDAMWVEAGGAAGDKTLKQQVFTSSGTWTRPTGVDSVEVLLVGGGGGGGGGGASNISGTGGGGGGGEVVLKVVAVTGNVSVVIGSGGTAGAGESATNGGAGGSSSFGAITAAGGSGGDGGAATARGGASGGANPSAGGLTAVNSSNTYRYGGGGGGAGGSGQASGAGTNAVTGGPGGAGLYGFGGGGGGGGGGAGSNGGGTGSSGAANSGGGGAGGAVNVNGFAGGSGICIVTWWE